VSVRALGLEIEVRTSTIGRLSLLIDVIVQLAVEGECRRLIMEQYERRAGTVNAGFSTGNGMYFFSFMIAFNACPLIFRLLPIS
jgi:hypothetical protein